MTPGPPPLRPFGLVLHHDARWTHEGHPVRNRKLREAFDRGVRYLPEEAVFVVQLGRFRGQIEVEEAAFFVRSVDCGTGRVTLSDGTEEALDAATLRSSPLDGALLCRVKRELLKEGIWARFRHSAHAELLEQVEEGEGGVWVLKLAGKAHPLPDLESRVGLD